MARVTVEDCIEKIPNRFELVMIASERARRIGSGAAITVERENDKKTVISLREIAGETINTDALKEEMIASYQRYLPQDSEEDEIDLMDGEKEWGKKDQDIPAASGIYADEEEVGEVSFEAADSSSESGDTPSLSDIAGI